MVDDREPEDQEEEDPPAYSADSVEATIRTLSTDEREKLLERLATMKGF